MTANTFQPITARPAPSSTEGPIAWVRINLFSDFTTGLMTIIVLAGLLMVLPQFFSWAFFRAAWLPDYNACRVDGVGAC